MFQYLDFLSSSIDEIRRTVARKAYVDNVSINDVLSELLSTDKLTWQKFLDEAKKFSEWKDELARQEKEELENQTRHCDKCRELFRVGDLKSITIQLKIPDFHFMGLYCSICLPVMQDDYNKKYRKECAVCEKVFYSKSDLLCLDHSIDKYIIESERLKRNLYRTEMAGLQSTLTLKEWLNILDRYNWKCAYCKEKSIESMDHIIPVSKGGGTIASNVVPCCKRCNSHKHARTIEWVSV